MVLQELGSLGEDATVLVDEYHESFRILRLLILLLLPSRHIVILVKSGVVETSLICDEQGPLPWFLEVS